MAGENTVDTLQGWFKELYADKEVKLVPEAAYITKNIAFSKSESGLGNVYHQPVVLTQEQGFTYAPSLASGGGAPGAFALNSAVPSVLRDAQVTGAQILLRSQIDYESLARAANSKGSFGEASRLLVENMMEAMAKRLELMFLYGRSPTGHGVAASGSTTTFVFSAASWAPGLWAGMEGAVVHVINTTGTYPSLTCNARKTGATGVAISSIDYSTGTLTFASAITAVAANDLVILFGTWAGVSNGVALPAAEAITFYEAWGLDAMSSISTGSIFNINVGTYGLYRPNLKTSIGTSLTVTNLLTNLLPAIGKGLMEDVVCLCSNTAFQGLLNPTVDPVAQAASANMKVGTQVTQVKSDKMVYGASGVTIVGYQGKINVQPHLFLKDKDVFVFAPKNLKRVGATDITFNTPGSKGGEFFLHLPDKAGYELRAYANQGLFSPKLGQLTKMTLT